MAFLKNLKDSGKEATWSWFTGSHRGEDCYFAIEQLLLNRIDFMAIIQVEIPESATCRWHKQPSWTWQTQVLNQ